MKLRAIRVSDVKGFSAPGKAIEGLGDGLNVLAAENEFGKSTLFQALRVALYEKHGLRNKSIEALRPYNAKGGPTVEVDIETETGRYRVHKRYLSRATASVIDLTTGRAIVSGDDVQDWMVDLLGAEKPEQGPTGLLWVEQGASLDQPKATKTSGALLSSLIEDSVSEVTGGAKVREVMSRASDQLNRLLTEKNKQATGRYRDALKERHALHVQIEDCDRHLQDAEKIREALSRQQCELAELENPQRIGEQQHALQAATEKLQSIQHVPARLEGLTREVQLTEQAVVRAEKDLKELDQVRTQVGQNQAATHEVSKKIAEQEGALEVSKRVRDESRANEDKHQKSLIEAKAIYDTVRKAAKARAFEKHLVEALSNLRAAEDVHATLTQARARIETIKIDRRLMERLEVLCNEADRAEAQVQAGQAKVSVQYLENGVHKVRVDGRELDNNETRDVDGRLVLDVDTVGRIVIDAGAGDALDSARQKATATRNAVQTSLTSLGVMTLAEARDALSERTQAEVQAKAAEAELQRIAPEGLQALQDQCAVMAARAGQQSEITEPTLNEDEAEDNVRTGEVALEACRRDREAAEHDVRAREQVLQGLKGELQRFHQVLDGARQRFGNEDTWDQQHAELTDTLAARKEELVGKRAEQSTLQTQVADYETVLADKKRLDDAAALRAARTLELTRSTSILLGQLDQSDKDGVGEALAEARDALERVEGEIATYESEVRALELLIGTLKTVEADAQSQFFEPVMSELKPLLHQVMPESELKLGSDFSPDHIVRDGLEEPFAHLSGGTKEQIAVLTRLAFARLMARKGRRMPVILDDALVYSDDDRIERMFKALQLAADDIQLIVLTCRQKTFQDLGGTKLQLVDWRET